VVFGGTARSSSGRIRSIGAGKTIVVAFGRADLEQRLQIAELDRDRLLVHHGGRVETEPIAISLIGLITPIPLLRARAADQRGGMCATPRVVDWQ
jgi:hypothetical protein